MGNACLVSDGDCLNGSTDHAGGTMQALKACVAVCIAAGDRLQFAEMDGEEWQESWQDAGSSGQAGSCRQAEAGIHRVSI